MILKKIRRLIEFSSENLGKLYQESCSHDLVTFLWGWGVGGVIHNLRIAFFRTKGFRFIPQGSWSARWTIDEELKLYGKFGLTVRLLEFPVEQQVCS